MNIIIRKFVVKEQVALNFQKKFKTLSVFFLSVVPKKTYLESCNRCNPCNDINGLICKDNKICLCEGKFNKEYYWNNTNCHPAGTYNDICPGDLQKDVPCQSLTQKTFCMSTSNAFKCSIINQQKACTPKEFKCKCQAQEYFNFVKKKCEDKKNISDVCKENDECNNELGLLCSNSGTCECLKVYGNEYNWFNGKCEKARIVALRDLTYDDTCDKTYDLCNNKVHLVCIEGKCKCEWNWSWSWDFNKCISSRLYWRRVG
jgi:hypothetical protein